VVRAVLELAPSLAKEKARPSAERRARSAVPLLVARWTKVGMTNTEMIVITKNSDDGNTNNSGSKKNVGVENGLGITIIEKPADKLWERIELSFSRRSLAHHQEPTAV
jgi:hypothetical protein